MTKNEKNQMKAIIKPLIKECLHEIMLQEGLIRMLKEQVVTESKQNFQEKPVMKKINEISLQKKQQAIMEVKQKVASSGFDPFAGTKDIDQMEAEAKEKQNNGVNISKLLGEDVIQSWNSNLG